MNEPTSGQSVLQEPDPVLVSRSLGGDTAAFRTLVRRHQPYLYALAYRVVGDVAAAEDVVQETFVRIWRHLPAFDASVRFTTWIYRIAVNCALDAQKRRRVQERMFLHMPSTGESAGDEGLAADVSRRDLVAQVREIAARLPRKQQQVFVLRDLQDLDVEEVAEILSMTETSIKSNLYHARLFIRRHLMQRMQEKGKTP